MNSLFVLAGKSRELDESAPETAEMAVGGVIGGRWGEKSNPGQAGAFWG